jgi:hypothetical protein
MTSKSSKRSTEHGAQTADQEAWFEVRGTQIAVRGTRGNLIDARSCYIEPEEEKIFLAKIAVTGVTV